MLVLLVMLGCCCYRWCCICRCRCCGSPHFRTFVVDVDVVDGGVVVLQSCVLVSVLNVVVVDVDVVVVVGVCVVVGFYGSVVVGGGVVVIVHVAVIVGTACVVVGIDNINTNNAS